MILISCVIFYELLIRFHNFLTDQIPGREGDWDPRGAPGPFDQQPAVRCREHSRASAGDSGSLCVLELRTAGDR